MAKIEWVKVESFFSEDKYELRVDDFKIDTLYKVYQRNTWFSRYWSENADRPLIEQKETVEKLWGNWYRNICNDLDKPKQKAPKKKKKKHP